MDFESVFTEQMNRLIDAFGKNPFSREKILRIRKAVAGIPVEAIAEVFDNIIDSNRYSPTPADIHAAGVEWKRTHNSHEEKPEAPFVLNCTKCYDTGWNYVSFIPTQTETLCFCDCKEGATKFRDELKSKSSSKVPVWGRDMVMLGFKLEPFPYLKFKPSGVTSFSADNIQIMQIVKSWKDQKNKARNYWLKDVHDDFAKAEGK